MNSNDASLVDLSGVPMPDESSPLWQETQAKLAPWVGVSLPASPADHPILQLLQETQARYENDADRHTFEIPSRSALPPDTTTAPISSFPRSSVGTHTCTADGKQPPSSSTTASDAACTKWFLSQGESPNVPECLLLRGWYATREEPRWCPCQSLFGGRAGRHLGVDLAAPPGMTVLAPVSGTASFNPLGANTRYGHHLFIFSPGQPTCGVLLAHLQEGIGSFPRRIERGESAAILGAGGGALYGGRPNVFGKYDTHLHVEVVTEDGHADPLDFFGLTPLYSHDDRCFFPADPLRLSVRFPHPNLAGDPPPTHGRIVALRMYAIMLSLPGQLLRWLAWCLFPTECADIARKILYIRRDHREEITRHVDMILLETLVCAEDRRFFFHRGFDPIGIVRAAFAMMRGYRQGGSTIEQQLVRTITQRRGIHMGRKLREILLAAYVASVFSKRATAEAYLCAAYYGACMEGPARAVSHMVFRDPSIEADASRRAAELVARLKYPEPEQSWPQRQEAIARRVRYLAGLRSNLKQSGWFATADWSLRTGEDLL